MYGLWRWCRRGCGLGYDLLDMLVFQSEVDFCCLGGLGEVILHQAGCETCPGSEETYVYVFAPGIDDSTKSFQVKKLYKGR